MTYYKEEKTRINYKKEIQLLINNQPFYQQITHYEVDKYFRGHLNFKRL